MIWDYFVVFAFFQCCNANMLSALLWVTVAEFAQGLDQISPGNIARKFHLAKISSRTKCNRMILGASIVQGSSKVERVHRWPNG